MKVTRKIVPGILFCLSCLQANSQSIRPFRAGDRVVFAGNSITEAGLYESYIWLYYMTRFPSERITVFNAGIGGDVAGQIYNRMDSDILAKKPTVLAVTFGMNDSRYFEYNQKDKVAQVREQAVSQSLNSFQKIEQRLKELPGVEKIIMTSSPYDESARIKNEVFHGKVETMEKIAAFQKAAAKKNHWGFLDWMHSMTAINKREQRKDSSFTLTGPDRIHPGAAGHFVMAYFFLKEQGLAGKPVATVSINAAKNEVLKTANCKVSGLKAGKESVEFNYTPYALPFPSDTVPRVWMNYQKQVDALKVIPFVKEFNQEVLTVKGLNGNNYTLAINGEKVGQWSGAELAAGINLAEQNTPQRKIAQEIMELNNKRRELESKFRSYYWVHYNFLQEKKMLFNNSDAAKDTVLKYGAENGWLKMKTEDFETVRVPATRAALQKQMDDIVDAIYQKNQPAQYHITLTAN